LLWVLLFLLKNSEAMNRVQSELDAVLRGEQQVNLVAEFRLSKLHNQKVLAMQYNSVTVTVILHGDEHSKKLK